MRNSTRATTRTTAASGCRFCRELVSARALVDGVVRSRRGHVYMPVAHTPSWTQVEQLVLKLYTDQLAIVDRRVRTIETEVEAIRFDVNEAQQDLDGPLGDDLRGASLSTRTTAKTRRLCTGRSRSSKPTS